MEAMSIIGEQISLSQRDLRLKQIHDQIQEKKSMLVSKQKQLRKQEVGNEFLFDVRKDYETYFDYIKEQKRRQYNLMLSYKMTMDGMDKLNSELDEQSYKTTQDKNDILEEMNKIKTSLDEIIT